MAQQQARVPRKAGTKVLIVDDHWVVVEGIKAALERNDEFEVVGTASDGLDAMKRVKSLRPDIVIMDISMPNMSGVEAAHDIKKSNKKTRIIVFTMYSDKEYVLSLFRYGISGYVLKDESISDLILALRAVKAGGTYYSRAIQDIIQGHMRKLELQDRKSAQEAEDKLIHLSAREKEVFPLLADGLSPREISERFNISPKTVESHKYNIMEKLNARSVSDLTKIALQRKLIKL